MPVCRLLVRGLVSLTINGIARRLHPEIGLLPKPRDARRRCRIFARCRFVAFVSAPAVIRIAVLYVLLILGRGIAVIGWSPQDLVRRGRGGGVASFTAPIVRALRRSRSAISAQFVHRHALTDEPCQLGKRVVSRSARLLFPATPTERIAIGTLIVFSH